MEYRQTVLMDDIHRRVPRHAVATSPSPERWLVEPMDGGPVLIAPAGCRVPDLVLPASVSGFHEVFVGLCSPDGHPVAVEARVGSDGSFARLRWEGGEIDYREVSLGIVDVTGKRITLRHPPGERSCVSHVRLVPR